MRPAAAVNVPNGWSGGDDKIPTILSGCDLIFFLIKLDGHKKWTKEKQNQRLDYIAVDMHVI